MTSEQLLGRIWLAMTDHLSKQKRSELMSRVRSKNTKPEILVRSRLHKAGYRFRLHDTGLPGSPDIILKRHRAVVFVNGCFWHGHDCRKASLPKSNQSFWQAKISRNRDRDQEKAGALLKMGWRVFTVWECDIEDGIERLLQTLSTENNPNRT